MNKTDIINFLLSIPVGTIIAWATIVIPIVIAIGLFLVKLYNFFKVLYKIQEKNDDFKVIVKDHDEQLKNISEQLVKIQVTLDKRDEIDMKKMRHSIVQAGEEAVSDGYITIRKLRSLEELYDEYRHTGNGYVTTLMKKVRMLRVIGELDENGEDIE